MNTKQAIVKLKALGFKFDQPDVPQFGTTAPEPYNVVGKDHFKARTRSVYFAKAKGGFYVTSHLLGDFRRYRGRTTYDNFSVANIFGMGKTLSAAINDFTVNFKAKTYNVRP
jgi:hypothetical protein